MPISSEKIRNYRIEIVLLVFVIIAIFIAIDVDLTLVNIGKEGRDPTPEEQKTIKKKAETVSLTYLIVSLILAYFAYEDYKEQSSGPNYYFFVATVLLAVAAAIREYWINRDEGFEGGAEDFVL